jgi:SSS family solute:Na+ symporter
LENKLLPENDPLVQSGQAQSYNAVLPLMLARYCGPGLLGLGVASLVAGFMSGMAGNVSAFATVWTYDIYRPLIRKNASDAHYVAMGRWCALLGVFVSIGAAYIVLSFESLMDYAQGVFSVFVVPLFATVILGMLWKRTNGPGAFWGLLAGLSTGGGLYLLTLYVPEAKAYVAFYPEARAVAENLCRAMWTLLATGIVTVAVTLLTRPQPVEELKNLVYGLTPLPSEGDVPLLKRPIFWAGVVTVAFIVLNILFW